MWLEQSLPRDISITWWWVAWESSSPWLHQITWSRLSCTPVASAQGCHSTTWTCSGWQQPFSSSIVYFWTPTSGCCWLLYFSLVVAPQHLPQYPIPGALWTNMSGSSFTGHWWPSVPITGRPTTHWPGLLPLGIGFRTPWLGGRLLWLATSPPAPPLTRSNQHPVSKAWLGNTPFNIGQQTHIMDSHGLCNWYSQPMTRFLHNSYSSWCWLTPRFFLISYIGRWAARPTYSASLIHEHQEEHETDWWTPSMHSIAY